jgi:hypothetical protein
MPERRLVIVDPGHFHVAVDLRWNWEAEPGGDDTHTATYIPVRTAVLTVRRSNVSMNRNPIRKQPSTLIDNVA